MRGRPRMGYNRFQRGRPSQNLSEFQKLNETTFLDFAVSRFESIPDSLFDEFAHHQSSTNDNLSTSLLEFKGIDVGSITGTSNLHIQESPHGNYSRNGREEPEPSGDPTTEYEEKLRKIQQRMNLINSLATKIEQNLHFNTPQPSTQSKEEVETKRLQVLQEDEDLYRDLDFGGNYQFDPKDSQSNRAYRRFGFNRASRKSQNTKLFSIPEHDNFFLSAIQLTQFHNPNGQFLDNRQIKDEQNKEIKKLAISFPDFSKFDDFYKFDDILQSVFIDHSKNFEDIRIIINYENNLAILCLLRFLLIIKSCNLFTLEFSNSGSYQTAQNQEQSFDLVNKVSKILERIFFVTLSIRNLQSLSIEMNNILFPQFCAGINRIADPSKLNLRYFYLNGDLHNANTNNIAECIKFFSRIPSLYAFQSEIIVINGKKSEEQFHLLLKNIQSIQLRLQEIPRDFSFELPLSNIIQFDVLLMFQPMQFNEALLNELLCSLQSSKNLAIFNLNISTYTNHHTSRRDILLNVKKQKQLDEQNTIDNMNENTSKILLFERFIDLPNLKQFSIKCEITQNIYDSLLKLLEKNSNILEMKIKLQNRQLLSFRYRNIFEILDNRKNLKNFFLDIEQILFIVYKLRSKLSTSYFFQFQDRRNCNDLTKEQSEFNSAYFKFNNVSQMILGYYFASFEQFENLFHSIENTPNLVSIEGWMEPTQDLLNQLAKQSQSNPQFRFFERLENLKNLKHINLSSFVNQQVLNSLESLIRKSVSLKSLLFNRYSSNQFYLNYSGLFSAISTSKYLEQLCFNSRIEEITAPSQENIKKWEELKLSNYYHPLAGVYQNPSSQLILVQIRESTLNEAGINVLLEKIKASSSRIYTKFQENLITDIINSKNDHTKSLLNQVIIEGRLVDFYFEFPFSQIPEDQKY